MKSIFIVKNPVLRKIGKTGLSGIAIMMGDRKAKIIRSKIKLLLCGAPVIFDVQVASTKTIDQNLPLKQNLKMLFDIPRMGHVEVDKVNGVKGLYKMVKKYFKPEFEVLEVGSFHGVSTMLFSLFAKKVYSVDCYDYKSSTTRRIPLMDKLMVDAEKVFLARTANIKNIIKIRKTSAEASLDFKDRSLDVVYIDGEHDVDSVLSDVQAWKNKVKKGGILSGHDWYLPHVRTILKAENLINKLSIYPDSSWSVVI